VRRLALNGQIYTDHLEFAILTNRGGQSQAFDLAEGYILSITAAAKNAVFRGQTYARIYLNRGVLSGTSTNFGQVLIADYITQNGLATWPGGRIWSGVEGPGFLTGVQVSPAAGADFIYNVGTPGRNRIRSASGTFTASATVANRNIQVSINDNGLTVWQASASVAVTAGQVVQVSFGNIQQTAGIVATDLIVPIPVDVYLHSGGQFRSLVQNIQAGDQWSAVGLSVEDWLEVV